MASAFPNFRTTDPEAPELPAWAREVAASLATRPSRASSLVSTRTRISTTTLQEDARSIDLAVGGQRFRISRDGSKVTSLNTADPLPPYVASPERALADEGAQGSDVSSNWGSGSVSTVVPISEIDELSTPPRYQDTADSWLNSRTRDVPTSSESDTNNPLVIQQSPRDGTIPNSQEGPGLESAIDRRNVLNRNPSYKTGEETITLGRTAKQRRTVSQNDLPGVRSTSTEGTPTTSPLRRRNGVRLPTLVTSLSGDRGEDGGSAGTSISPSLRTRFIRSAGAALPSDSQNVEAPSSPSYYGQGATGLFPSRNQAIQTGDKLLWAKTVILKFWRTHRNERNRNMDEKQPSVPPKGAPKPMEHPQSASAVTEESTFSRPSQAMDAENDISNHYTQMIRFIDRDYRLKLHARDKDMAELRERLHEKDTVYRQELKSRDFVIEDLRKRLTHLEETLEEKLERARNEVEDLWEKRWKDRDHHLMERMRRMEADSHKAMETVITENEQLWMAKYQELWKQHEELGTQNEELGTQNEKLRDQHEKLGTKYGELQQKVGP